MRQRDVELRELREVAEAAADLQSTDQQAAKVIDLSKKVGGQGGMLAGLLTCTKCVNTCCRRPNGGSRSPMEGKQSDFRNWP